MWSWLYDVLMISANETLRHSVDHEIHALASLLHNLGWDKTEQRPIVSADQQFEVDGAFAARDFIQHHKYDKEWDEQRVQLDRDAIVLHTERSILDFKELDVQIVSKGIAMVFPGPAYGVSEDDYAAVAKTFPKDHLSDKYNIWYLDAAFWTKICETRILNDARIPGTTEWFFDHERTKEWQCGNNTRVLWLHGPSATGKTFVTSSLVSHIQQSQVTRGTGVAVFHFGRRDLQYGLADYGLALSSITRQFVSQLPAESTLPARLLKDIEDGIGEVESTAIIVNKLAFEFSRLIMILDGVDTSNEAGLHELMDIFLERSTQVPGVRIMMTSQNPPSNALIERFGIATVEARASDKDLSLYHARAMDEKSASPGGQSDSHTRPFPSQRLIEMADGRFLPLPPSWSNIASQPNSAFLNLSESWSPNSSIDVPRVFCEAFFNEIKAARCSELKLCALYYLVTGEENGYTFTPSMLWEALIAWGIRDEDKTVFTLTQISEACFDFAFIDPTTKTMKLRSPLLRDYLRTEIFDDKYHKQHIKATFQYLTRKDHEGACKSSQDLKERLKAHPFLCYAARTLSLNLAAFPPGSFEQEFLRMAARRGSVDSYLQAAEAWPYIDGDSYDECEAEEERWCCYTKGYTPLHLAAHLGIGENTIQALVDRGYGLEAPAENGQTPLHIAAEDGDSSQAVKRLLECGANVAAVDEDGLTPLAHAIVYGCLESVRLLISHGADIKALDEDDLSECFREKPDIAEFLVELGIEMPDEETESDE
ncbi:ankyrin-2 [Fusarium beomiforme]|uniref:Ankyrin-2 n=1 Tax=Fusarium beomiforme TaxID=44412 RepID=A0A9P5DVA1_9HYPO|nr:ankyrin-2 [Fusarium beomiforme]